MNKQLLILKGFPANILNTKWEEAHLQSPAKLQRIAVEAHNGTLTAFLSDDLGVTIDRLLEDESVQIQDMLGVHFPTYFAGVMKDGLKPIKSKFLYIYGLGEELANSTTFADKMLSNLIKTNKSANNHTVVCSDVYAPSLFSRNYPLSSALVEHSVTVTRT